MKTLKIPSFAKLNLALKVTAKRRDGYHDIDTVFQTIDLHDELTFRFSESSHFHLVLDIGRSAIPADSTNLIYKACHAFRNAHSLRHRIEVKINKSIPVESGLGGGSSNAAATLIALSRLYNWPLKRDELVSIAARIGADVPFFLFGGTARGTGRGDKIQQLPDAANLHVLLVPSRVSCSTAVIYQSYDASGLLTENANSINIHLDQRPNSLRDLVSETGNDLERVVFALHPELASTKQRLLESGADVAALTGSGSAVFGLFSDAALLKSALHKFPGSIETRFISRQRYESRLRLKEES